MTQYQILRTNIITIVWQAVRRITNKILGVKGLSFRAPHFQSSARRANINFFFPLTFLDPRDGLRRKGETTRGLLTNMHGRQKSIPPMGEVKSTSS